VNLEYIDISPNSFLARYAGGLYEFLFEAYLRIKFWKFSNSDVLLKLNIYKILLYDPYHILYPQRKLAFTTTQYMYCLMLFDPVIEYLLSSEAIRSSHNSVAMYYQYLLLKAAWWLYFVNIPCLISEVHQSWKTFKIWSSSMLFKKEFVQASSVPGEEWIGCPRP
jgi:hypothetical protein